MIQKKSTKKTLVLTALIITALTAFQPVLSQSHLIEVNTKKIGAPIQKTMWGLFFEDINYAADGGLYAELIKNRSFDFPQSLLGWTTFGSVEVLKQEAPFPNNPNYIRLTAPSHKDKHTGIENEGFFGIAIKKDAEYSFSCWARNTKNDNSTQSIRIELVDDNNNVFVSQNISIGSTEWKKYQVKLKSNKTIENSKFRIVLTSKGSLDLEHISLFPKDTWNGRENGMRKDIMQVLYDLKPGLFRFPGGCIVEGTELHDRYQWKNSVGPVENRKLNINRWQYTFPHRFSPDYFQSYGLGFFEYFLIAKDLGAEPLPVLNCGMVCQYQNNTEEAHVCVEELDEYIQDAIDLIEFANGDTTTNWGKLRAQMGHPESFNLKQIAIGNEQWGSFYSKRLEHFQNSISKLHPDIVIVGSSGPSPDGKDFDFGWSEMRRLKVDMVDEHYYRDPKWFLENAGRYDTYDRKGPKVFAGEYACHPKNKKNNFESALCEAAFMTGLERNADIVYQCTYAPLLAHTQGWQWRPDLIWFDNMRVLKTPNYYVQQLFASNAGTHVLPTLLNKKPLIGQDELYASSTINKEASEIIIKIVNTSKNNKTVKYIFNGLDKKNRIVSHTEMTSTDLDADNSFNNENNIKPTENHLEISNNTMEIELKPTSVNVYKIKI